MESEYQKMIQLEPDPVYLKKYNKKAEAYNTAVENALSHGMSYEPIKELVEAVEEYERHRFKCILKGL